MGILVDPKPINYWTKERKAKANGKKRSSTYVATVLPDSQQPKRKEKMSQAEAFVLRGETVGLTDKSNAKEAQYIEFLEKRIVEWQTECRKMANEAKGYANQIAQLEQEVIRAKTEPRNVTGEVQEVMKEVMELRANIAYLESKLFGGK
jgi:predicted RNase H-like nuclease (RuvC/YqgF family)